MDGFCNRQQSHAAVWLPNLLEFMIPVEFLANSVECHCLREVAPFWLCISSPVGKPLGACVPMVWEHQLAWRWNTNGRSDNIVHGRGETVAGKGESLRVRE